MSFPKSHLLIAVLANSLLIIPSVAQLHTDQDHTVKTSPVLELDRLAAVKGAAVEQLKYARDLNDGILGRRNYSEAFRWFTSASRLGSIEAESWLGSMYLLGHGVAADPTKAHQYLEDASKKNDKIAYRFLGTMCEEGIVERQDYSRAFSYYQTASKLGDANSFDRRGLLRLAGLGVTKSPKLAFTLFSKGAALGDQWSQLHLGQMYRTGIGIPVTGSSGNSQPNFQQALRWLQASAQQNNRVALFVLGNMTKAGQGTQPSDEKAFEYYQMSAAHRYAPADVAIGHAHEDGRGAQINLLHAYVGYSLAAEQGNVEGISALQRLSRQLSASEIQQARDLLAEFKKQSGEELDLTDTNK